jgi:hypothetical protein
LDGPFPKWCPAVALSHQDGRHSAVALLLKAALIQVSDYRFLGASGFVYSLKLNFICYLNRFFTFDYSLWDGGRHTFLWAKTCGQKQTLIKTEVPLPLAFKVTLANFGYPVNALWFSCFRRLELFGFPIF